MTAQALVGPQLGVTLTLGSGSTWLEIQAALRQALLLAGHGQTETDSMLGALRPVALAVERAGTRVDADMAWALLACVADQRRRVRG